MRRFERIALVLLAIALTGGIAVGLGAWRDGYRLYAVQTGSMAPSYPTGDLILTEPPPRAYAVGDVVTFRSSGGPAAVVTHRISRLDGTELETKGDANRTPDAMPISTDDVVGRVIGTIPRGGYALVFLRQPTGGPALAAMPIALMLLWGMFFPGPDPSGAGGTTRDSVSPLDEPYLEQEAAPGNRGPSHPRPCGGVRVEGRREVAGENDEEQPRTGHGPDPPGAADGGRGGTPGSAAITGRAPRPVGSCCAARCSAGCSVVWWQRA